MLENGFNPSIANNKHDRKSSCFTLDIAFNLIACNCNVYSKSNSKKKKTIAELRSSKKQVHLRANALIICSFTILLSDSYSLC